MYGAIHRDQVGVLTGGTHYERSITHDLGTADFCTFLVQDITSGAPAAAQGAQRLFVPNATRTATTVVVQDWTNPPNAPCYFDAVMFSRYSVLDVGPVVTGNTRSTAQTAPFPSVSSIRNSYRSLHHMVPIIITAGQLTANVTVTHNLYTSAVAVFVTPLMDPFDTTGYPIPDVIRFWEDATARTTTTCRIMAARGDGLQFANTQNPFYLDVMVVAVTSGGLTGTGGHSTTDIRTAGTADYNGGDRAVAGMISSYWSLYQNVDNIVVAPGFGLVHNLGAVAGTCLFGLRGGAAGPVPPTFETPYIIARGAAGFTTTRTTIGQIGGADLDNVWTMVMRPYSTCCPTLV